MTVTPVIGTALIKTYKLLGRHHGGVTVMPMAYREELEPGTVVIEMDGVLYLNWIESSGEILESCRRILRIGSYDCTAMRTLFKAATKRNDCPQQWVDRTEPFLGPWKT